MTTSETGERARLFRDRARELRKVAPRLKDLAAAEELLQMAASYDALASRLDTQH